MRKFYLLLSVFLSFFYPVRVRKGSSIENPTLELYLYRNRWQLATADALYSDGDKYRPLVLAFRELEDKLPATKSVLVLGAGLGSAVTILHKKGYSPAVTLVDNDKLVLQWALEKLGKLTANNITPVCDNAQAYMQQNKQQYDMVIIDIFSGRIVPDFVTKTAFLENCRRGINPGGSVIFNYIVNHPKQWDDILAAFTEIFPANKVLKNDTNRILIATV